uniref:Putative cdk5 activator-binding protein n=1 Tax=Corethrella appendiculata TaxID=1370023 RepID=U5EMN2_9DIPT
MNEADIPIDIHIVKLQEWLISRRIVKKNWNNLILDIRNKINNAIIDMPVHDGLVKLLYGAHINYFHCVQIIEILKTTEADTKNVFGRYGSQRMKDWQEIVRAYEKDDIYLAEAAQILVRNLNFEIPGLRKQISKFEQLSDEAEKKIKDLKKSAIILRNEHQALCQQLGIKGENVRAELLVKLNDLPQLLENVAKCVPILRKAIELYTAFYGDSNCLSIIRHIAAFGNTTVYQFLYAEPPLSIEQPSANIDNNVNRQVGDANNEIDFGDNADEQIDFGEEEIDFGNDDNDINLDVGDIDWGEIENANSNEIDFNISLEESGIVVESTGTTGGVAKNEEALTVLDSPIYKEQFINELLELEAFLKIRLYELNSSDKAQILAVTIMDSLPDHDVKSITEMLGNVSTVYGTITNQLLQDLHQIKHSPKYVNILTAKLKQKLTGIEKINSTELLLEEKLKSLKQQTIDLQPTLKIVIEQTKILQKQIEKDISKRYKNRVVNLMGNI